MNPAACGESIALLQRDPNRSLFHDYMLSYREVLKPHRTHVIRHNQLYHLPSLASCDLLSCACCATRKPVITF
jgi:predicted transposase YdaD